MPLPPPLQTLVDAVEGANPFDGRFRNAVLINYDAAANQLRGCFSLVFRAIDEATGETVALKFFNPQAVMDVYRLNSFRREHEILKSMLGAHRCLQLASGLNKFDLLVPMAGGVSFPLPCEYFAIQWIDDDIDDFFLDQENAAPLDKLLLLCDIVNAVKVLHVREIYHRDLKYDNLRAQVVDGRRVIFPIDMGAAARFSSAPLMGAYGHPAGAPYHSSPEARSGLAGNRRLAPFTDIYALGCMLFELFNKDFFYNANLAVNAHAHVHLAAMAAHIDLHAGDDVQCNAWAKGVERLGPAFSAVRIDGAGSSVPPGIAPLLNELLAGLTSINYRKRPTLRWTLQRLQSARAVLTNEREYQRRLVYAREMRRRRIEAVRQREARFLQAQLRQKGITNVIS